MIVERQDGWAMIGAARHTSATRPREARRVEAMPTSSRTLAGTPAMAADALTTLEVGFSRLDRLGAATAGEAWRTYRRAGGPQTRVIADFLIGAYAQAQADRLLTRDRGLGRSYFGGLTILDPTATP